MKKPNTSKERNNYLSVKITDNRIVSKLEIITEIEDCSKSLIVEKAVAEYIEKHYFFGKKEDSDKLPGDYIDEMIQEQK